MSATTGLAGWLNRVSAAAAAALNRTAAEAPVLGGLPGPGTPSAPPAGTAAAPEAAASAAPAEATAPADAGPATELPAGLPFPNPKTSLERLYNALWDVERRISQAETDRSGADADKAYTATQALPSLTNNRTSLLSQIGAEENRQRDDIRAETERKERDTERREREAEAKAERERLAAQQPKNGDTRQSRVEHNGVTAVITETYNNGQWSYVSGSAKPDTGLLGQPNEQAGVALETARVNLQRAQAQLALETDPLKREQLQLQIRQLEQTLNKPTESTQDGYLVRVSPAGEVSRVDLLTPDQRRQQDEATALKLEADRRGTLPTNAYAALQQETSRLQGRARDKLAELQQRQQRGELSAEQASNLFQTWFQSNVQAPLEGLRAAAEEAQRTERAQVEERNRLEDIRVQQANQQREQLANTAGEAARRDLVATFPGARSPEFAQAFGANVAAMSQRAQGRTAEERMNTPRGPGYTGAAFDPGRIAAVMPSPDAIAAAARDRALAAIAPAVAVRSGYTAPSLPTGPDIAGLLARVPYQGVLSAAPAPATGLLPTPGRDAVDLGTGMARTYYGPNGEVWGPDWRITP